ncbi:MAG: hypothetical protein R3Y23_05425 [Bacillota bacterium]
MKKSLALIIMVVVFVVALTGCNTIGTTQYNTQILTEAEDGGVFNYDTLTDMQENWTLTSGGTTSTSFTIVDNGDDVANYITLSTSSAGYAQMSQTVYLRAYSYYKISYTYTTSTMGTYDDDLTYEGLYVNFLENESFNIDNTDWSVEERGSNTSGSATIYFQTSNIREVTIALNLGSEDHPVTCSSAIIKTFTLEKVEKSVALENTSGTNLLKLTSAIYGNASILNVGYIVLGSLGTIALSYGAYIVLARKRGVDLSTDSTKARLLNKIETSKSLGMMITLMAAILIRLLILAIETGIAGSTNISTIYYGYDLEVMAGFASWISEYGTPYFLQYQTGATLMPLTIYLYSIAGAVGLIPTALGATDATITLTIIAVYKALIIAFDIATVAVIYKVIAKRKGKSTATIMATFFALLPVMFSMSSAWGTAESVATFFIALSFYYLLDRKIIKMSIAFFMACMTSALSLVFAPFVLMYVGVYIYNSIVAKDKNWIKAVACIVGGFILFYLITLPFTFNYVADGDVFYGFTKYLEGVKGAEVYSSNAFNFQGLIGNNFGSITTASMVITIMFVVFVLALLAIPYFKNRSRLDLVLLAASGMVIYWTFCNDSNHATMIAALPLMFMYTAIVQDKRLFATFSMYSACTFINTSYIYLVAGYTTTGGITQLDYSSPVMYIMGVINIILVIVYIVFAYDTIVTKQVSPYLTVTVPLTNYYSSITKNVGITIKNTATTVKVFFVGLADGIKNTIADRGNDKDNPEDDNQ